MKLGTLALAFSLLCFAACDSTNTTNKTEATTQVEAHEHDHDHDHDHDHTSGALASNAAICPVCGMENDGSWTDYTVYKGDTVWFCAASEKTAFEGNPTKYEKNLKHQH